MDKLGNVSIVQGPRNEQDEIIDHVGIGEIVKKGSQGLHSLGAHKSEFVDKFSGAVLGDSLGSQRGGLVLQKVTVVRALELSAFLQRNERLVSKRVWTGGPVMA